MSVCCLFLSNFNASKVFLFLSGYEATRFWPAKSFEFFSFENKRGMESTLNYDFSLSVECPRVTLLKTIKKLLQTRLEVEDSITTCM